MRSRNTNNTLNRLFAVFAYNSYSSHYVRGFTLLEMIVSLGIFSVLVVASIGVTIGVSSAQLRAAEIQAIQDNIRFSLELITKEMRTGSAYTFTTYGTTCGGVSDPVSRPTEITFDTSLGEKRTYYLDTINKTIMRISNGGTDCQADAALFTAESVDVERLLFAAGGNLAGPDDGQPHITISLNIKAQDVRLQQGSSMDLQTTVIQRFRDL